MGRRDGSTMSMATGDLSYTDPDTGIVCSGDAEFVSAFAAISRASYARRDEWVQQLRQEGVRAIHPDDGWVDRKQNSVHFCYPRLLLLPIQPGDIIVLGSPDRFRRCRITKVEPWLVFPSNLNYYFEEIPQAEA